MSSKKKSSAAEHPVQSPSGAVKAPSRPAAEDTEPAKPRTTSSQVKADSVKAMDALPGRATSSVAPPQASPPAQPVDEVAAASISTLHEIMSAVQSGDPVVDALAKLEVLRQRTQSRLDAGGSDALKATLNDLLDAVSDARTKLNQNAIEDHTLSLQAAEDELDPGIHRLESLRDDLARVAHTIDEVAEVIGAADTAISGVRSVLASFGAV